MTGFWAHLVCQEEGEVTGHEVKQTSHDRQEARGNTQIITLEVQDQTRNGLQDDPCEEFPTTKGQSLVFGLPQIT